MSLKTWGVFGALLIVSAVFLGLRAWSPSESDNSKIKVATSFYPLYYFVTEVGGDLVSVSNITPAGVESHDYEPTGRDIALANDSKLLVILGLGYEPWKDSVTASLDKEKTRVLEAGSIFSESGLLYEENISDPHIWLSPRSASLVVDEIERELSSIDRANASVYKQNADTLRAKLSVLDQEYKGDLAKCERKDFVTSHSAFKYLAEAYGLEEISIAGLSPEAEPSLSDLAKISDDLKHRRVRYVFFEPLGSREFSDIFASEIQAKTLPLNPLEGLTNEEEGRGEDYFSIMEANLANLKLALECNR